MRAEVLSTMDPLERLNSKIFSEHLQTNFKVSLPDGDALALKLVEVAEKDTSPKIELFFLYFRGPTAPRLPQQIYRLEHEQLGSLDIFLTTIGADEQGTDYEAVFHRFRKPQA